MRGPGGFFDGTIDEVRVYDRALSATEIVSDRDTPLGLADATAPTTPGDLTVTGNTTTAVTLGWTASTDDVGVSGYTVYVGDVSVGTTTSTTFTVNGLSCSTGYVFDVEAFDTSGTPSPRAEVTGSTAGCAVTQGLVAAYGFDESSGTSAGDASGNGQTGAVAGATWVDGLHGGALSFDGTDDHVALPALGTFYNTAFTLEAWVRKAGAKKDVGIVGTWAGNGPMLWIDHLAGHHYLTLGNSLSSYLDSGVAPSAGLWQHVAATFDGATARFYVNGTQVATRSSGSPGSSNTWRIGAYGGAAGGSWTG